MSHDNDHRPLDPRELVVSKEVRNQRLEICETCEYLNSIKFCKLCKCLMPAKTWLKISSCPVKKWGKDT